MAVIKVLHSGRPIWSQLLEIIKVLLRVTITKIQQQIWPRFYISEINKVIYKENNELCSKDAQYPI